MIRRFRARHIDVTFRDYERKELAKINGEDAEHVLSDDRALRRVEKQNLGLFSEASQFWNLDESSVMYEVGTRRMALGTASTLHGGLRVSQSSAGGGRHLTAIVVVSVASDVFPPFFLFRCRPGLTRFVSRDIMNLQESLFGSK